MKRSLWQLQRNQRAATPNRLICQPTAPASVASGSQHARNIPAACAQNKNSSNFKAFFSSGSLLQDAPYEEETPAAATTTTTDKGLSTRTSRARVWDKITSRIVATSPGSLTSFQLHELEEALQFWTMSGKSNWEFVRKSFQLLDRLEQESEVQPHLADMLSHDPIFCTINQWQQCLKQHQHHQKKQKRQPKSISSLQPSQLQQLSPLAVLQKLESYATNSTFVRPDAQLYNMIMDALAVGTLFSFKDEIPSQIETVFQTMKQRHCLPTKVTYASAIHALCTIDRTEEALELLQSIQNHDSDLPDPTIEMYGSILGALARKVSTGAGDERVNHAIRAEALLHELQHDFEIPPNTLVYSHVLHAWAQTASPQAGERAQALLNEMMQYYQQHYSSSSGSSDESITVKPNHYCFASVMKAHAQHGRVHNVENLLKQLQQLYNQTRDPDFFPNRFCFHALMEAYTSHGQSQHGHKQAPRKVEAVLQRMVDYAQKTKVDDCFPDLVSFNHLLYVYAKERHHQEHAAQRALALVEHMKTNGIEPDTISYNCVLECLAKCHWAEQARDLFDSLDNPDIVSYRNLIKSACTAEEAEQLLVEICRSPSCKLLPDVSCFNVVISAWAKSKSLVAGPRAEALLRQMKLDLNIEPQLTTYNAIMDAWRSMADRRPEAAERALLILRCMQNDESSRGVQPNAISFTKCLWAFAAARQPAKAQQLFGEMQAASIQPNIVAYCAVMSAWAKVGEPEHAQAIFDLLVNPNNNHPRPNTIAYSTILHAWANAGHVDRAVSILQQMCEGYSNGVNPEAKPDERCFAAVIGALSNSNHPDAAPQAEACLGKMQDMASQLPQVRPNIHTFQQVISAWANSDLPIAAEQAERHLHHCKDLYENGDRSCQPNVIAYTNVLRAWGRVSRSNTDRGAGQAQIAVERSEALLAEMLASPIAKCRPNRISFGTVLRTIADSRLPDKLQRAQRIVQIMEDQGMALDRFAQEQIRKASSL